MSQPMQSFKVGQAPWEKSEAIEAPPSFKVGQAPWETEPSQEEKPASMPETSKSESAMRGAAQGGTLGFADEISGAAEALWEKAKGDPRAFGEMYKQYRDESRANFEAAKKANPNTYLAGEVGGGIATAFVPGLNLAKGASVAKIAGQSALLGGIGGAGYSTENNTAGVLQDAASGAVVGGVVGAGAAKLGQVASKIASPKLIPGSGSGPSLSPLKPKANAEEIKAAAKQLGVELTDAQVLDDGFLQKLDSMLQQSPTLIGRKQADVVKKGMDAVGKVADESLSGATTQTQSQVGEKLKESLASKIRDEKAPIGQLYEKLRESTANMELSPKSLEAVSRNIKKMRESNLGTLKGLANGIADDVTKLKNVDDVKFLRTQLRQGINYATPSDQVNLIGQLDRKLKALEESTVLRTAKNFALQTKDKNMGQEILGLIDERKTADKAFSQFMTKLNDFSGVIKGGKVGSAEGFVRKLEAMPEEEFNRRLFAKNNAKGLNFIRENFPDEANEIFSLEKAKLKEKFTKDGKVNAPGLIREIKKYSPEVQEMLFGKEGVQKLKAARTYVESLGEKANPSETETTRQILSFFQEPLKAIRMTGRDLVIKGILKASNQLDTPAVEGAFRKASTAYETAKKPLSALDPIQRTLRRPFIQGAGSERPLYQGPMRKKVGESEEDSPQKGPKKWVNDGLDKLEEHAGSDKFRSLKDNPKARKLLIAASDVKPGSKAMEQIMKKLEEV